MSTLIISQFPRNVCHGVKGGQSGVWPGVSCNDDNNIEIIIAGAPASAMQCEMTAHTNQK